MQRYVWKPSVLSNIKVQRYIWKSSVLSNIKVQRYIWKSSVLSHIARSAEWSFQVIQFARLQTNYQIGWESLFNIKALHAHE
ncbi:MAG: hypothetical protein CV089_14925 [Nitrospira sp. WS110]|nr:hypothetical protein [Nitrospira sp. WS110]